MSISWYRSLVLSCFCGLACCLNAHGAAKKSGGESVTLRVAAYNVERSKGVAPEQIGEMLKPYKLDIIGFSEAPDGDWTERVGKVLGMKHAYVGKTSSANHKNKYKTILSKTPLTLTGEHVLTEKGGWNPASAVKATTQIDGVSISFYSLHVCGMREGRDKGHARELASDILPKETSDRVIVVGDFNNKIGDKAMNIFEKAGMRATWGDLKIDLSKHFTWDAQDPQRNAGVIDHILYNTASGAKASDGGIIEEKKPLSDHKPVWAAIEFPRNIKRTKKPETRPAEEGFDYFENNWNVVGLKDYDHGSRITPDNELLVRGKAAIAVRIGSSRKLLSRKQGKRALHGWMPILRVDAVEGSVRYEMTYWATPLPDAKDWKKAFDWPTEGDNFLTWIRVRAVNFSDKEVDACAEVGPNPKSSFPQRFREPQAEPKGLKPPERVHRFSWRLPAGGSAEGVARYTFFPSADPKAYDNESADVWLERTEAYWQGVMEGVARVVVPEKKATDAMLAAHVCQLIANDRGEVHGGENFYDIFYPRDGAYQVLQYFEAGLFAPAKKAMEPFLKCQDASGRFHGPGTQAGQLDSNGQVTWALWKYYMLTGDREFLVRVYPAMLRAMRWTMQARRKAPADSPFAGLLPAAPADGESLWKGKNHIVGYDLWNLRGMLCTADAARILKKHADAKELLAEASAYRKAIDAACKRTRLAYFPPSWEKRGTHWGNTETLWPTELFDRDDPRVDALVRHVREDFAGGFLEGTIQWKGNGKTQAIHPYMSSYTTMTDLVRGQHEKVVEDFYWYLLHSTAAHAFPEGIYYKERMAWAGTIPHVTGACNYAIMLRHMLIHETGDDLHLLSAVPDWWLGEGEEIRVEAAPTHFGKMGMLIRGTAKGVEVRLDRPTRNPPKRIMLTLPKSRPLVGSLEGVEVVTRSDQEKRWDFPRVVSLYEELQAK